MYGEKGILFWKELDDYLIEWMQWVVIKHV